MPADRSHNLLFQYNSQNPDDTNDSVYWDQYNKTEEEETTQSVNNTVEALVANSMGTQLAASCSEFCQSYSIYQMVMRYYRQFSGEAVPIPAIANFLPEQDYLTALQQFSASTDDARAYMHAWEAGQSQQEALSHALGLCEVKMHRAANLISHYYENLSSLAQSTAKSFAEQHLEIVFNLAGRSVALQVNEASNAHEERLKSIDYSDAPENYFCPITHRLMTDPVKVIMGHATHVYDRSVLTVIIAEKGEEARCPVSQCLLKDVQIIGYRALKEEIEQWVEEKVLLIRRGESGRSLRPFAQ